MFQNGALYCSLEKEDKMEEQAVPAPAIEGLMWQPDCIEDHNLTKIRQEINAKHGLQLEDYHQLHKWSCDHYDLFWAHVWDFCGVKSQGQRPESVVDPSIGIAKLPKWFPGVTMNYAENLLRSE